MEEIKINKMEEIKNKQRVERCIRCKKPFIVLIEKGKSDFIKKVCNLCKTNQT